MRYKLLEMVLQNVIKKKYTTKIITMQQTQFYSKTRDYLYTNTRARRLQGNPQKIFHLPPFLYEYRV